MRQTEDEILSDIADMTDEEQQRFAENMEEIYNVNQLQGLVQALPNTYSPDMDMRNFQAAYGPPPDLTGGFRGMTAPQDVCPAPRFEPVWTDDTHWTCSCGQLNEGKFCMECGSAAPAKTWICPSCGAQNSGKFCGECGSPKNKQ